MYFLLTVHVNIVYHLGFSRIKCLFAEYLLLILKLTMIVTFGITSDHNLEETTKQTNLLSITSTHVHLDSFDI